MRGRSQTARDAAATDVPATSPRGSATMAGIRLRYSLFEQTDRVTRLAWSPDGSLLAVPSRDGRVRVHDAASGALRTELAGHTGWAMGVAWSPDGRTLASIGFQERARTWDVARGTQLQELECSGGDPTGIAWCPRGGMLAASCETGSVQRWHERTERRTGELALVRAEPLHSPGALHLAWSPDSRRLAVGARDGTVRVWDPWSGTLLARQAGHRDAVVVVAWAPDGRSLASGSKDGTILLWDAADARLSAVLDTHRDHVMAIAFSPDGSLLASKSRDGSVLLWRPRPWRVIVAIPEPAAEIGWTVGLAFHPQEPLLATLGEGDRIVRVWETDPRALPDRGLHVREIASAAVPWPHRMRRDQRQRVLLI